MMESAEKFDSHLRRIKHISVSHREGNPWDRLPMKWIVVSILCHSKVRGCKAHAWNLSRGQVSRKLRSVDVRSTNMFVRFVAPTADRNIRHLCQTNRGIQQRRSRTAKIRTRVYPLQSGFVEEITALPVLHRDDSKLGTNRNLNIRRNGTG